MINNFVEGTDFGGGVVHFKNAFTIDWDYVFDLCEKVIAREKADMYTLGTDPETGEEIYINRSGYFFGKDGVDMMPGRGASIHRDQTPEVKNLLTFLEKTKDEYLYRYLEYYPLAFKCIWWKVKSHIVGYKESAFLGSHSDISTDYIYGVWTPTDQLAMRSTVTNLMYFNDSVDSEEELNGKNFLGGHHYFNYMDLDIKPEKGDLIFFPASYTAAHEVLPVKKGIRYSYLGWYSQGTPNPEVNENVADPNLNPEIAEYATNVYMPNFVKDYQNHLIQRGYNESSTQYSVTKSSYY